jgi:hypothetical protein
MKQPDYSGYESAKQRWIASNPNATPEQYTAAMIKLAARYGV